MIRLLKNYGLISIIYLVLTKIFTVLTFRKARLIRYPIIIRGKAQINVGYGFTTGKYCRIETFNNGLNHKKDIISIGQNVQINDMVHISGIKSINIGNNTLIASRVYISDHDHGSYEGSDQSDPEIIPIKRELFAEPIVIKDNVWIGENVSILKGVCIGLSSIIGANSVVTKDIPDYCIAVGSPARVVKTYCFKTKKWKLNI